MIETGGPSAPALYRAMLLIRRFEERVFRLFLEGEIPGTLHQYQGQEAVAVGVCDVLRRDDWVTSTHRPHGHALAKGVSSREAMAELYGKRTGACKGKGGSMHLGDPAVGMLPAIAIVAGGASVVSGMGLAMKLRATDQVAVVLLRRRRHQRGRLPRKPQLLSRKGPPGRLRLREQPLRRVHSLRPGLPSAGRGRAGSGLRGASRDRRRDGRPSRAGGGRRAVATRACRRRAARGRMQDVPVHGPQPQRRARLPDAQEEEEWASRDPLLVLRPHLDDATEARLEAEVKAELDDAVEFARSSPYPSPEEALEDVYA